MKIFDLDFAPGKIATNRKQLSADVQYRQAVGQSTRRAFAHTDRVEISGKSIYDSEKEIQSAKREIALDIKKSDARVEEIRRRVQSGSYEIDPAAIAGKLLHRQSGFDALV